MQTPNERCWRVRLMRLMGDRLGHHTMALVDRIYTHPTTAGDKLVREALSRIVRQGQDSDAS